MVRARSKPFYSKKRICQLIDLGSVVVAERALARSCKDFGWGVAEILEAIKRLPGRCCYKSETRYDNPKIWVDFYRVKNLMGENVFTHFYVDDECLVIDSFKELNDEMP